MKFFNRYTKVFALSIVFTICLLQLPVQAETIPFDSPRWVMDPKIGHQEEYQGKKSLYLKGGVAYIEDLDFTNGIIEFDVAFSKGRGFFGAVFRVQDKENYEEFYLRSHQSGNPDATQYSPVYNGMAAWQLYHGKGYSANVTFDFDKWMHIKLVVSGKRGELYIGDNDQPALEMHDLKREIKPGPVGLKALPFSGGHFANFSVTPMDAPALKHKAEPPAKTEPGTLMTWDVSNPFPESLLENKLSLTAAVKEPLKWKTLVCEPSGLANLSRAAKRTAETNTVFARVIIESGTDQVKALTFGYSDRVKVYMNNRLLYSGLNNYRSRDYRYLGTIGYFDEVYLPLKKGKNELLLAVSESFGGWGIKCRIKDMTGITVK